MKPTLKNMNHFREIEIPIKTKPLNLIKDTVKSFNHFFVKDDLNISLEANKILISLKEIDIDRWKRFKKQSQEKEVKDFSDEIIESIESVKSYGIKNGKRNYTDYNKERKTIDRKEKENKRGIHYYANDHHFSKENNKLPENFENQIICGDSISVLKKLPDNCVDVVFTSPPYNFGLDYANSDDANDWEKYFEKLFAIFDQTIRVLKYGGRIIVNLQPLFSDYIPSHHFISQFFISKKMIWKGEILWEKNNYNCKYTAWGSWKSPSSPYLKYTWEFLEIFSKGDLKHKGDKEHIDISEDEFKKYVIAKWSIAPERKMKEFGHPAMFPEKLVERGLKLFSYKNDVVLDPFNGVGTTTAVAKKLNRKYIGIDVSEKYCETAHKRIENIPNKEINI